MGVSIIVPAYNAGATLGECIEGCLAQTHADCEVIVVDDGSTDITAEVAAQYPVRYLRQSNGGPAAARNLGANLASGDILAFTDSDCVPAADWIARLLAGFTEDDVVAVGGTYANANPQHRLSRLIHAEIRYRHSQFAGDVDFLGSFNFAVRREAFEAVGRFDELFRAASAEDNDLSYRLGERGRLRFAPDAIVAHRHPRELWAYLNTQRRHGMWRVKLYAKHHDRAARGDQYANVGDLMQPLMAWILLGLSLLALSQSAGLPAWVGPVAIAGTFAGIIEYMWVMRKTLRGISSRFEGNHFRLKERVYAMGVFYLRDLARGLGLLEGIWHFVIRGKRGGTREWLAHS